MKNLDICGEDNGLNQGNHCKKVPKSYLNFINRRTRI